MSKTKTCKAKNPNTCAYHHPELRVTHASKSEWLATKTVAELESFTTFFGKKAPATKTLPETKIKLTGKFPEAFNVEGLKNVVKTLPKNWDGVTMGTEMLTDGNNNWNQIEWAGWYFEHWADKNLTGTLPLHGNGTVFDSEIVTPNGTIHVDLKTHTMNTGGVIPLNDKKAIDDSLEKNGQICFMVADGEATYGNKFEDWRVKTRGGKSAVSKKNLKDGKVSRPRKDTFKVSQVHFYVFTKEDAGRMFDNNVLTIFNQGVQASGAYRNPKYKLDTSKVEPSFSVTI